MEKPFSVLLTDLDGVVFWRIPAQKAGLSLQAHTMQDYLDIPKDRAVKKSSSELSPLNLFQAARHMFVPVFPDVARVLNELDSSIWVYGNTGRHNNRLMVDATAWSLQRANLLDRFKAIMFREDGTSTVRSKLKGLERIRESIASEEEIVVVDDNPIDLMPMAYLYPSVRFILIKDLTTRRLLANLNINAFPNVTITQTLRQGIFN